MSSDSEVPPPAVITLEPDFHNQGYQPVRRPDWTAMATAPTQQPMEEFLHGTAHSGGGDQATGAYHLDSSRTAAASLGHSGGSISGLDSLATHVTEY